MMKMLMMFNWMLIGCLFFSGTILSGDSVPLFRVDPSSESVNVWGHAWPAGSTISVSIEKEPGEVVFNATEGVNDDGDWGLWNDSYQVEAGDLITVSDGTTTIENYAVTSLTLSEVNYDNNTVSGTAESNSFVSVQIQDAGVGRHVAADEHGNWIADFSVPFGDGEGWDGTADLNEDTQGGVCQCPEDRSVPYGSTHIGFGFDDNPDVVYNIPYFLVNPENESISGDLWWESSPWSPNTQITIFIGATNAPDYVLDDVWSDEDGYWTAWDIEYDIQVGDLITVADGVTTVAHEVRDLEIEEVDVAADKISGFAVPGSWVGVSVHDAQVFRSVQADSEGSWMVDFSVPVGDGQNHNRSYDIQPGDQGWAIQDHDGGNPHGTYLDTPYGSTTVDWAVAQPRFEVNPFNNMVWGNEWPTGQQVTVSIGYDIEDPYYTGTVIAEGDGRWWLDEVSVNIVADMYVKVQCVGITKEHQVRTLWMPMADADNDTVSGTASSNAWVNVHIYGQGITRDVQADSNGQWLADFSEAFGSEPWESSWDIVEGTTGDANIRDEDGDATTVPWIYSEDEPRILLGWFEDGYENGFACEVEGPGVMGARVRTPSNEWHNLATDSWFCEEWEFEVSESSYSELIDRFPAGEYLVEITTAEGTSTKTLMVPESLERPNAHPEIISPQNGATGIEWPEIPLKWAAAPSPNFNLIALEIEDDEEYEVEEYFGDNTMTEFLMKELEPETTYEGYVAFANMDESQTADGWMIELVRARFADFEFATGEQPSQDMQDRLDWYATKSFTLQGNETWSKAENKDRFGKGLTLRQEHLADTDPNDPESLFRIIEIDVSESVSIICDPSSLQRVYTLQYCTSLTEGDWIDVPGQTQVTGGVSLQGMAYEETIFYRVIVELPE